MAYERYELSASTKPGEVAMHAKMVLRRRREVRHAHRQTIDGKRTARASILRLLALRTA